MSLMEDLLKALKDRVFHLEFGGEPVYEFRNDSGTNPFAQSEYFMKYTQKQAEQLLKSRVSPTKLDLYNGVVSKKFQIDLHTSTVK